MRDGANYIRERPRMRSDARRNGDDSRGGHEISLNGSRAASRRACGCTGIGGGTRCGFIFWRPKTEDRHLNFSKKHVKSGARVCVQTCLTRSTRPRKRATVRTSGELILQTCGTIHGGRSRDRKAELCYFQFMTRKTPSRLVN